MYPLSRQSARDDSVGHEHGGFGQGANTSEGHALFMNYHLRVVDFHRSKVAQKLQVLQGARINGHRR